MDEAEVQEALARVEVLLGELEDQPKAVEAVQTLVELYGEGLFRIVNGLPDHARATLAGDELVSHLLVLHDLHPVPLEERVRAELDDVRHLVESEGGEVALVAVDEGVVRVRLDVGSGGCASSPVKTRLLVEESIKKAVPDVEAVLVEGVAEQRPEVVQIGLPQARVASGGSNGGGRPAVT